MFAYFLGQNASGPSTSATNYGPLESFNGPLNATEINVSQVIPHALTIDRLFVKVAVAPGAGGSGKQYAATLMVNGVASALTCTILETATSGSDVSHSVNVVAGDLVSLRWVPTGTPAAPGVVSWFTRQSASGKFAVLAGTTSQQSAANFFPPQGMQLASGTETNVIAVCPIGGTISNLYLKTDVAPGGSGANSITVTLRQAAAASAMAATALTATITDPATTAHDTTHSFSVSASDKLTIGLAIGGTPSVRVSASYTFTPTSDGDACWMHGNSNTPATGSTNYDTIGGLAGAWSATESNRQQILGACTLKALYIRTSGGPGTGGKQYTDTVRLNGAGTALTLVTSGAAAASFSITGQTITVNDLDLASFESVPASTPFSALAYSGVYYTAASAPPANTVAPAVTGTPAKTDTLTTTNGTWTNTPTGYTYQWQRDVAGNGVYSNIGAATSSTYVLASADVGCNVRCVVTATNSGGSVSANSNSVGLVGPETSGSSSAGLEVCGDGTFVLTIPTVANPTGDGASCALMVAIGIA